MRSVNNSDTGIETTVMIKVKPLINGDYQLSINGTTNKAGKCPSKEYMMQIIGKCFNDLALEQMKTTIINYPKN